MVALISLIMPTESINTNILKKIKNKATYLLPRIKKIFNYIIENIIKNKK